MLIGSLLWHAPASGFECPKAHDQGSAGVVAESRSETDELGDLLASGDIENRVEVVARDLRQRYPDADKTELTNYMVSAYCQALEGESMSDMERSQRLSDFGNEVWRIYTSQGL